MRITFYRWTKRHGKVKSCAQGYTESGKARFPTQAAWLRVPALKPRASANVAWALHNMYQAWGRPREKTIKKSTPWATRPYSQWARCGWDPQTPQTPKCIWIKCGKCCNMELRTVETLLGEQVIHQVDNRRRGKRGGDIEARPYRISRSSPSSRGYGVTGRWNGKVKGVGGEGHSCSSMAGSNRLRLWLVKGNLKWLFLQAYLSQWTSPDSRNTGASHSLKVSLLGIPAPGPPPFPTVHLAPSLHSPPLLALQIAVLCRVLSSASFASSSRLKSPNCSLVWNAARRQVVCSLHVGFNFFNHLPTLKIEKNPNFWLFLKTGGSDHPGPTFPQGKGQLGQEAAGACACNWPESPLLPSIPDMEARVNCHLYQVFNVVVLRVELKARENISSLQT